MAGYFKIWFWWLLALPLLVSCQNAGEDIGDLYGMWRVERIVDAGQTICPTELYLSFHGNVVEAKHANSALHGYEHMFGSLRVDTNSVTMRFIEIDISVVSKESLLYQGFHFPQTESFTLSMRLSDSKTLCLACDDVQWLLTKY